MTPLDTHKIRRRINILKWQLDGILQMLESDRPCEDVLIQIKAIKSGIDSMSYEIASQAFSTCLTKNDHTEEEIEDKVKNMLRIFVK